jgi:predicted nucleotidyltransferase
MNPHLDPHLPAIRSLCCDYGVNSLQVFGSVLRHDFRPDSDIDLLVDFNESTATNAFQRFFGFKEAMEQLLGRPVDLITLKSIANPYFRRELEESSQSLYAA